MSTDINLNSVHVPEKDTYLLNDFFFLGQKKHMMVYTR